MSKVSAYVEYLWTIDYDYDPPEPDLNFQESVTLNSVSVFGLDILERLDKETVKKLEQRCIDDVADTYDRKFN